MHIINILCSFIGVLHIWCAETLAFLIERELFFTLVQLSHQYSKLHNNRKSLQWKWSIHSILHHLLSHLFSSFDLNMNSWNWFVFQINRNMIGKTSVNFKLRTLREDAWTFLNKNEKYKSKLFYLCISFI